MSATAIASTQMGQVAVSDPAGTACDAVNGNVAVNTGKTMFRFVNSSTSAAVNVTFTPAVLDDGEPLQNLVDSIASGSVAQWYGEFDPNIWGREMIFTAAATSVKVTVFEP